jgi:nicotinamidase/pyrazinamidase
MARALLVVDVQPTFCEGGELPVTGANDVAFRIAEYLLDRREDYGMTITSQDWHLDAGGHFSADPDFVDTWPPHGLAGTSNAELHPALRAALGPSGADVTVKKGMRAAAYSAFDGVDPTGRGLAQILLDAGVDQVDVCGIAESHCVRASCLDALAMGLWVRLLGDLTVPVTPESGTEARRAITSAGGRITSSESAAS